MTKIEAMPYKSLGQSIVVTAATDDADLHVNGLSFLFDGPVRNRPLVVEVRCSIDPDQVGLLLSPGDASLVLRSTSASSRTRQLIEPTSETSPFERVFTCTFDLTSVRGSIELEPLLVLSRNLPPSPGNAHVKGSVLATGEAVIVVIDPTDPPVGPSLPIEWRSFEEEPMFPDENLFHLESDPDPKLFLNSDIDGLHSVLMSKGTHGRDARIRDAVFAQIVLQVWTSLFAEAFRALRADAAASPDAPVEELLGGLDPWKRQVLEDWSRQLTPGDDPVKQLLDADDTELLTTKLPAALQSRFSIARKGFTGINADPVFNRPQEQIQ